MTPFRTPASFRIPQFQTPTIVSRRVALQLSCLIMACSLGLSGCNRESAAPPPTDNHIHSHVPVLEDPSTQLPDNQTHAPSETPALQEPVASTPKQNQAASRRAPSAYLPAQLSKNHTLLVLVYQSDIRADAIIRTARKYLDEQQTIDARKLALSYDKKYLELRRQRAAILETATDDLDVEAQLLENKMDIADLTSSIRRRINQEVLRPDQRKQSMKDWEETLALRAAEKEKADQ